MLDRLVSSTPIFCDQSLNLPLSDEETDGGDEGDDADEGGEVASASVLVHHAHLLVFVLKTKQ